MKWHGSQSYLKKKCFQFLNDGRDSDVLYYYVFYVLKYSKFTMHITMYFVLLVNLLWTHVTL